jgi:hypothetical protein
MEAAHLIHSAFVLGRLCKMKRTVLILSTPDLFWLQSCCEIVQSQPRPTKTRTMNVCWGQIMRPGVLHGRRETEFYTEEENLKKCLMF